MGKADADLERCKKSLRSILLANKGGIPFSLLSEEYYKLFEEDLPFRFRKSKFSSLGMH